MSRMGRVRPALPLAMGQPTVVTECGRAGGGGLAEAEGELTVEREAVSNWRQMREDM
jgi:hypothetical protein